MAIKAIQTVYKGYKFRSRLEARWAIFFDALGIDWGYEVEGYELSDGTWYLPDFVIDGKFTIEIKPMPKFFRKKETVYMAGTMKTGEGWRGIGVTDRRSRDGTGYQDCAMYFYGGPFSLSCDHGCAHGAAHMAFDCGTVFNEESRKHCLESCFSQISKSDVFAIYIDRADLYGSLVELGYAKALGKAIWFGISPDVISLLSKDAHFMTERSEHGISEHELWFAQECADYVYIGEKEFARKNFDEFIMTRLTKEQQQAAMIGSDHYVIYGDPVDYRVYSTGFPAAPWANQESLNPSAAIKARQARFEHGETPQ